MYKRNGEANTGIEIYETILYNIFFVLSQMGAYFQKKIEIKNKGNPLNLFLKSKNICM